MLHAGAVVDFIAFRHAEFNAEIIRTARPIPELGNIRFARPELLVVMHLLRPGPEAALAAVELVIARNQRGGIDVSETRRWAAEVERAERLERVLEQAESLKLL